MVRRRTCPRATGFTGGCAGLVLVTSARAAARSAGRRAGTAGPGSERGRAVRAALFSPAAALTRCCTVSRSTSSSARSPRASRGRARRTSGSPLSSDSTVAPARRASCTRSSSPSPGPLRSHHEQRLAPPGRLDPAQTDGQMRRIARLAPGAVPAWASAPAAPTRRTRRPDAPPGATARTPPSPPAAARRRAVRRTTAAPPRTGGSPPATRSRRALHAAGRRVRHPWPGILPQDPSPAPANGTEPAERAQAQ